MTTQRMTVPIKGMTCAGCVSEIEQALRQQDGIVWATVNFAAEEATIIADPSVVGMNRVTHLIRRLGFDVASPEDMGLAAASPVLRRRSGAWPILAPVLAGAAGALALVALYLVLVTLAQGWRHAAELLWGDRWLVGAIAVGFGVQAGLYLHLRQTSREQLAGRPDGRLTAAGAGASSVAMLACCVHHVTDLIPLLGLSAAAVLLNQYRIPFMMVGLGVNLLGIAFMVWRLRTMHSQRRPALVRP